jgi:hypothetical protein
MAKERKRPESGSVMDPDTDFLPNGSVRVEDYRDRIAMRAYELYLARGGADGGDFDDWLAAEREIGRGTRGPSRENDAG